MQFFFINLFPTTCAHSPNPELGKYVLFIQLTLQNSTIFIRQLHETQTTHLGI